MKYAWIAGTGGVGKGEIFKLLGNHTLGREESRSAVLTPYRDYCKAHIILSYAARLTDALPVYILGAVGGDERGRGLLREMERIGLSTEFMQTSALPTKYSVCFLYEDGTGGNITSCNDACSEVTAERLFRSMDAIVARHGKNGIFLAAPEVRLKERAEATRYAKRAGATTFASVLSCEADEFIENGYAADVDVLAVNSDEIVALGKGDGDKAIATLYAQNPNLALIVTAGKDGAVCYAGGKVEKVAAVKADVVSTAGAGDALLGGTIAEISVGQDYITAVKTGAVCAAVAVESPHTIPDEPIKEKILRRVRDEYHCD